MVNFTVKKETKKKMMQMKFLERNYFPFQIVQLRWTRRTKCIQYNLTQFNPIDYRVYIRNFISNN